MTVSRSVLPPSPPQPLTLALPKGRILQKLIPLFERAGLDVEPLLLDDRRLVRTDPTGMFRYLFLKPDDVPTYVEYGAADLGVCGKDVLLERSSTLYEPVDLRIGRCQIIVAGPVERPPLPTVPRVATKLARIAADHFLSQGKHVEVIPVGGSVELAPRVGLSDLIVDLMETGNTLRENKLEVREVIMEISSVLVANRAAFTLRHQDIAPLVERIRAAVAE